MKNHYPPITSFPGRLQAPNWVVFFVVFFFAFFLKGFGQGVEISSPEEPGPTQANPIPINISFEDGVDELTSDDFEVTNGALQNLQRGVPGFEIIEKINLDSFKVIANSVDFFNSGYTFFDLTNPAKLAEYLTGKLADVIIAFDFDSNGNIFYLTYGNGVFKLGEEDPIIDGENFASPLDLTIDNSNRFIIADPENYRVRIFNSLGNHLYDIGGAQGKDGNEFYGPTGLAVNKDNLLYVADAFLGNDPSGLDQIKIYRIEEDDAVFIRRYGDQILDDPYRIAVDKNNNLYVSDAGGNSNSGRIVVFDNTDNLEKIIANSAEDSPGSIIVDEFGYLYVINYLGELNFTDIYQNPEVLLTNFNSFQNANYQIDVFSPVPEIEKITSINENLNIPLDLNINACGNLYVLDMQFSGTAENFILGYPTNVDVDFTFDLEIFQRQDNFTADVFPDGPGLVEVELNGENLFKCGPQPDGEFSIVFDDGEEDLPPQFENCPQSTVIIPNDSGECGAIVIVETPTAIDDNGGPYVNRVDNGPESGEFFPVGIYEIIFEADDGVNDPVECRYTIRVGDNESPVITCPDDLEFEIPTGETTVEISYPAPTISDNCEGATYSRISGPASGTQQAEGIYTVVFEAEDASENKDQCSIEIVVTKEQEPFEITCVENRTIELSNNQTSVNISTSEFIQGDTSNLEFDQETQVFSCADIGTYNLTITARNPDTGEEDSCVVEVTVVDTSAPVIYCYSAPIQRSFAEGESFEVPEFYAGRISDNCTEEEDLIVTQNPPPGTIWDTPDTYTVSFTVTDASNNSTPCSFQVELSEEAGPIFTCPDESDIDPIVLDENCDFQVPNYTGLISTSNFENTPNFKQNFERIDDEIFVEIEVFDGPEYLDLCYFSVALVDATAPSIECPNDIELVIPADENSAIVTYSDPVISDNCDSSPQLELFAGFASGEVFPVGPTEVRYRVIDASDNESFCSFFVTITRENDPGPTNTAPVAKDDSYSVPQDENLNVNEANGVLANDEDEDGDALIAELRDAPENGTLNLNPDGSFTYTPDAGFFGTDTFTYVAFDGEDFSNLASVSIVVNQVVPGNDAPVARDDEYETEQNTTLVVQAANGILQNDSDPNDDPLTALLMNDVSNGTLDLNPDGSFTYSPASGFTGTDSFTYMANDGITNSNIATVTINVISTSSDFQCREEIVVSLDASGNVSLALEDLYTGDASGLNLSASKLGFDCSDLGENSIELSWSGQSSGDCEIKIIVEDTTPPVLEVNIISISLDEDGFAEISAEELDAGSYDNCGDVSLSLNRTSFSCEDLGQNSVLLTATDVSGNMRSTNTIVFVNASPGICRKPGEFVDETFISPNPTSGEIEIFTPEDMLLERIVVFDTRGRYIKEKEFTNRSDYRMQLNGLQDAVYILHIFTSRRVLIKKLILRN
ncbi:Ig-like domain-containing protein [Salegentibacter sp. HM20]